MSAPRGPGRRQVRKRQPRKRASLFRDVFEATAKVLDARWAEAEALDHRGLRGHVRERALVLEFLSRVLPPQFRCVSGEVADSHGGRSRQQDIVVFHASRCPPLYTSEAVQVVPVEAVLAVVEVKTELRLSQLDEVVAGARSVKRLKATAYERQHLTVRRRKPRGGGDPSGRIAAYVVAWKGPTLDSLRRTLTACERRHGGPWMDGVFVLDRGSLIPAAGTSRRRLDGQLSSSRLVADDSAARLLRFYLSLWQVLVRAWTEPIRLGDYFTR